jgi:hypothetical protein
MIAGERLHAALMYKGRISPCIRACAPSLLPEAYSAIVRSKGYLVFSHIAERTMLHRLGMVNATCFGIATGRWHSAFPTCQGLMLSVAQQSSA